MFFSFSIVTWFDFPRRSSISCRMRYLYAFRMHPQPSPARPSKGLWLIAWSTNENLLPYPWTPLYADFCNRQTRFLSLSIRYLYIAAAGVSPLSLSLSSFTSFEVGCWLLTSFEQTPILSVVAQHFIFFKIDRVDALVKRVFSPF